jgi:hypothetical protein
VCSVAALAVSVNAPNTITAENKSIVKTSDNSFFIFIPPKKNKYICSLILPYYFKKYKPHILYLTLFISHITLMKSVIRHTFIALSVFSLGLGFTSCKTSRNATEATAVSTETKVKTKRNEAAKYVEQIEKAYPKASHLTAKTKMQIKYGSKDLSVSGNLKMKRDEAIQLSLRILGFEVGRVEFTPAGVLVLDRINSQYFRATYNDVSYLKASGLDFNALQSLFWNELFAPNDQSKKKKDGKIFCYPFIVSKKNLRVTHIMAVVF